MTTTPGQGAQTVIRAIAALKILALHPHAGLRLVDLARDMELERPTAHRLLQTLVSQGMVVQDTRSRRYRLGPLVFELGLASAPQFDWRDISDSPLRSLAEATGDSAFLFVRSGDDAVCLHRVQGDYPIQTPVVSVGSRQPLGVNAGGLALLSALPEDEMASVIAAVSPRLSAYGNLDANSLRKHCIEAQRQGFAAIGNHAAPGIAAIGLPILSVASPIAAVTVASTQGRMTTARMREILPLLEQAGQAIAARLHPDSI